jgi:threonine/homoserine/homoserine lactone efflux protein
LIINILAGIITGFIVSIPPVGPIAFAMISKGFSNEIKEGKAIAFGAAFMDFFYCLMAFGGINLIISFFPAATADFYTRNSDIIEMILTFSGCVIVIIYGLRIMKSKITYGEIEEKGTPKYNTASERAHRLEEKTKQMAKHLKIQEKKKSGTMGLFFMGILLCLSSITLPASWIGLIAYLKGFNILNSTFTGGLLFSIGAFAGTAGWFYTLLKLITGNKKRINQSTVNKLNVIAGIILLALGVFLFIKAAVSFFNMT